MPLYPEPGEYTATQLPMDALLFRSYMLLRTAPHYPDAQKAERPLKITRLLIETGERAPELLSAGIVTRLPEAFTTLVARRISAETAVIMQIFNRHARHRFTYIDQAPVAAQKLAMAYIIEGLAEAEAAGDRILEKLQSDHDSTGGGPSTLSLLPEARPYLLLANKLRGNTSNTELESRMIDAVLGYNTYRRDYLLQILALPRLPAEPRTLVATALNEAEADATQGYPSLKDTRLLAADAVRAAWNAVLRDARLKPAHIHAARRLGECLSAVPGMAPDTVAAALIGGALGQPAADDIAFLHVWLSPGTMALLQESREARMQGPEDLLRLSRPLREVALAKTILSVEDALGQCAQIMNVLRDPSGPHGQERRQIAHAMTRPLADCITTVDRGIGSLRGRLGAPALEQRLEDRMAELQIGLEDIYEAALQASPPAPPTPRRPGPR